jgi:serine/threonine protein phosphatase 1
MPSARTNPITTNARENDFRTTKTARPTQASNGRSRLIAIGDIHGHAAALRALLGRIDPTPGDTLVFLGDYVDRGPDTKGVIEILVQLIDSQCCSVIPLLGNHEEMLLQAIDRPSAVAAWLQHGGDQVLASYAITDVTAIPTRHQQFLRSLQRSYETDQFFFLHANYAPNWRVHEHDSRTSLWTPLEEIPARHYSGKTAILGHTPQPAGNILDAGHVICIDTGCGFSGPLTAYEVHSRRSWQVSQLGELL